MKIFLFKTYLILSIILLINPLIAQNRLQERKLLADNRIKTKIVKECKYVFGTLDSCVLENTIQYDEFGREIEYNINPNQEYSLKGFYSYNQLGRCVNSGQIYRGDTTFGINIFDTNGLVISHKNFKNQILESNYISEYKNGKLTLSIEYDSNKNMISKTNFKYDDQGNMVEVGEFKGKDSITYRYWFDSKNRQIKSVRIDHKTHSQSVSNSFYNEDTIELIRSIRPNNELSEEKFIYDNQLRLIRTIRRNSMDQYDNTKVYDTKYDDNNYIIKTYWFDQKDSTLLQSVIQNTYDSKGLLISSTYNSIMGEKDSKKYIYNNNGKLIKIEVLIANNCESIDIQKVEYIYDSINGNLIQKKEIESPNKEKIFLYKYDNKGKLISEIIFMSGKSGEKSINICLDSIDYKYDSKNNIISERHQSDFIYQAFLIMYKDTNILNQKHYKETMLEDYTIGYKYNENNLLIEKARLKGTEGHFIPERYFYDTNGYLIETQQLDIQDNTIRRKMTYQYDSVGNLYMENIEFGDGDRGETLFYKYDSSRKLIEKIIYDSRGSKENHIKYYYDEFNKLIKESKIFDDDPLLTKYEYETY